MALTSDEDTDNGDYDDDDEVAPPKKRVSKKKRGLEVSPGKVESKRDRESLKSIKRHKKAEKMEKMETSEDDDDSEKDSRDEGDQDLSDSSSSDSGLEEFEKKGTDALEALFDAEVSTGARYPSLSHPRPPFIIAYISLGSDMGEPGHPVERRRRRRSRAPRKELIPRSQHSSFTRHSFTGVTQPHFP